MRILNYVLAMGFFAMAGLQFNDPDPVYWVAVYGGTALIALSKGLGRYSEFWAAITIGGVVAGLIFAVPGVLNFIEFGSFDELTDAMTASKPYIESTTGPWPRPARPWAQRGSRISKNPNRLQANRLITTAIAVRNRGCWN